MTDWLARVNWRGLRRGMEAEGIDVLLGASIKNFFYITDSYLMSHKIIPDRLGIAVVPQEGDPAVVVHEYEALQTRQDTWMEDVRIYVEFQETPMHALAGLLQERGFGQARLGVETEFLAAGYVEELAAWMPEATIVGADQVFQEARAIKSSAEVDVLRRAALATEGSILAAFQSASPGDTEKKVSDEIHRGLIEAGATSTWVVLGSGDRTAINHPYGGPKKLTNGEIMRVDVGGVFDGYQSDVARTAVIGTPTAEQVAVYQCLRAAQQETIAALRAGVRAGEIYQIGRNALERGGLRGTMRAIGHSLGTGLHDFPMLHAGETAELEPGMVLNIELAVHDARGWLFHVEDTMLVTDDEPQVMTTAMDADSLFTIE